MRLTQAEAANAASPEEPQTGNYCDKCSAELGAANQAQSVAPAQKGAKAVPVPVRPSQRAPPVPAAVPVRVVAQQVSGPPKAAMLFVSVAGLVVFIIGLAVFLGRGSGSSEDATGAGAEAKAPVKSSANAQNPGAGEQSKTPAEKKAPESAQAKEKRAEEAFADLERQFGKLDRADKKARLAGLNTFLVEHGEAIVAARARRLLSEVQKMPEPGIPTSLTPLVQPPPAPAAVQTQPAVVPTPAQLSPAPRGRDEETEAGRTVKALDSKTAYKRFRYDFAAQLQKYSLANAAYRLDCAEKDPVLNGVAELKKRLQRDHQALEWLKEAERAVAAGAEKLKDCDELELLLVKGSKYRVGKKADFAVAAVAGEVLQLSGGGVNVSVALSSLQEQTRDRIANLAFGADARALLCRAFLQVLAVGRQPNAPSAADAQAAIEEAHAAGAGAEDVKYLLELLEVTPGCGAELQAEKAWRQIEPLLEACKWAEYWEALEKFASEYGATECAQDERARAEAAVSPGGIVFCLKYTEAQAKQAFDAAQGKHGALQSAAAWDLAKGGAVLNFESGNGYVDIPAVFLNGEANWTWAGWIWPANSGEIYTEGNPCCTLNLHVEGSGAITLGAWHNDAKPNWVNVFSSAGAAPSRKWSFVALSLENGGAGRGLCKFYVNGRLVSSANTQAEFHKDAKFAAFGVNTGAFRGGKQEPGYFQGRLRNVRIYKRALSAPEMEALPRLWPPELKTGAAAKPAPETTAKKDSPPLVYLCEMNEVEARMGLGNFRKNGTIEDGKNPIKVNGIPSPHGLFTHPGNKTPARVVYALGKAFRNLRCGVGINDSSRGAATPLVFKVVGDGRVLWASSPPLKKKGDERPCLVSVQGVDRLELIVECNGKQDWAHAVWLEPRVER